MKQFWTILSVGLSIVAVMLAVSGRYDAMFITATLGAVAWFLGYRARLRETVGDVELEPDDEDES